MRARSELSTRTFPDVSSKRLPGLMSRWTIPSACNVSMPRAAWIMQSTACATGIGPPVATTWPRLRSVTSSTGSSSVAISISPRSGLRSRRHHSALYLVTVIARSHRGAIVSINRMHRESEKIRLSPGPVSSTTPPLFGKARVRPSIRSCSLRRGRGTMKRRCIISILGTHDRTDRKGGHRG